MQKETAPDTRDGFKGLLKTPAYPHFISVFNRSECFIYFRLCMIRPVHTLPSNVNLYINMPSI